MIAFDALFRSIDPVKSAHVHSRGSSVQLRQGASWDGCQLARTPVTCAAIDHPGGGGGGGPQNQFGHARVNGLAKFLGKIRRGIGRYFGDNTFGQDTLTNSRYTHCRRVQKF